MPIRKKDGSLYTLKGPNPLMQNQIKWKNFKLHNMRSQNSAKLIEKNEPVFSDISFGPPSEEQDEIELVMDTPDLSMPETETLNEFEEEMPQKEKSKIPNNAEKIRAHVLPAKRNVFEDDFFDESYTRITYDQPKVFEAIVVQSSDILFFFWTHEKFFEEESIIYPKTKDKRWWKVQSIEEISDGYVYKCIPSDQCPSFD